MIRNVVLAGVGGQGLITIGRIMGEALLSKGYNVLVSEVHGLSQRGGSVVIYLKYGKEKEISPIVPEGYAEVEIALELIEALRYSYLLSK
ncbi:MAG TPA: indolepyruvate oxidoreductase subunit beta, partial [Thermofilum sp.]|nr:indolepyruvate oxidoreductase subunit beta [Thermofilum sp.]